MTIILFIFCVFVLLFGFVILFGAPYLPTLRPQIHDALELLDLKKGQTLLELGSGDGRILNEAARRGLHAVGYEINPILVVVSYFVTYKYRASVEIRWMSFWRADWPRTDGIYVFLLDKYMKKLDKKVIQQIGLNGSARLVSFGFEVPNKVPDKSKNGMRLYVYNKK